MADQGKTEENAKQSPPVKGFPWAGLIILLALATLGIWLLRPYAPRARYVVNTCFQENQGLRERARVRLLGVEVGYVRAIRPQLQNAECRVRVEMAITDQSQLRIPKDSVASIETEGVLGPSYVELDVRNASAATVEDGGTLPSREPPKMDFEKFLEGWPCNCGEKTANSASADDRTKGDNPPAKPLSQPRKTAK